VYDDEWRSARPNHSGRKEVPRSREERDIMSRCVSLKMSWIRDRLRRLVHRAFLVIYGRTGNITAAMSAGADAAVKIQAISAEYNRKIPEL